MSDRLAPPVLEDQVLRLALEQELQAPRLLALLGDNLAGSEVVGPRRRNPSVERGVVEVVEQVDRAQLGGGDRRGAHASARYSWISETAIEPSPTALATRLIERARTSPATNTPGTLVSST